MHYILTGDTSLLFGLLDEKETPKTPPTYYHMSSIAYDIHKLHLPCEDVIIILRQDPHFLTEKLFMPTPPDLNANLISEGLSHPILKAWSLIPFNI